MGESDPSPPIDRSRLSWWLFVVALGAIAAYVAQAFLGVLVLGVFGYYATRPINRRLSRAVDSDSLAAWTTIVVVLLPLVAVLAYTGLQVFQQAQQALDGSGVPLGTLLSALPAAQEELVQSVLRNPRQYLGRPRELVGALGAVSAWLFWVQLLLGLAVTLTYFLLANDDDLADGFRTVVGGEGTTAHAYATAVDEDLESVFFGNFLFVLVMVVVGTGVYWLTNLVAPAGLSVPFVFLVGFLTGVTSLIPMVVSKVVYMPVVAYLAVRATAGGEQHLPFVAGVFVVYFFVLDFLPQTFLQPYVSGRHLNTIMLMFGYLLGPIVFGWYGLFLLPILFIMMLEAVRIVVPELAGGESLTTTVDVGKSVGATPRAERDDEDTTSED